MINDNLKTILFDFDGTLIDHFHCIYRCYVYAARKMGHEPLDFETVRNTVGGGIQVTMAHLMSDEESHEAVLHFRTHFEQIMLEDIHLLPGTNWLLDALRQQGYYLSLFTNKPKKYVEKILPSIGLDKKLDNAIGTLIPDEELSKPMKAFTEFALNEVGSTPEQTLLIGDSHYDIDAAHCVNMPCFIVLTGSHTRQQLENHHNKATKIYNDLYELGQDLFNLTPPEEKEKLHSLETIL